MNYIFKTTISSFFILLSSQSFAISDSDAVIASKTSNAAKAAKIWTQLAFVGDSAAQYNLAGYYSTGNGVQKNEQIAKQYLKDAARSGLIEAYLNLNKKGISPAKGRKLNFQAQYIGAEHWLKNQKPNQFTIQIASSRNEQSIKRSYDNNNLKGKGGYYHYVRDGINRYALVYGSYKSVAAANTAMSNLPQDLRKKSPWVRRIRSLHKVSQ